MYGSAPVRLGAINANNAVVGNTWSNPNQRNGNMWNTSNQRTVNTWNTSSQRTRTQSKNRYHGNNSGNANNGSLMSRETDSTYSSFSLQSSRHGENESVTHSLSSVRRNPGRLPPVSQSYENSFREDPISQCGSSEFHTFQTSPRENRAFYNETSSYRSTIERSGSSPREKPPYHVPPSSSVFVHAPIGLHSFGNTCYMNAALQCILHTPGFLDALYEASISRCPIRGKEGHQLAGKQFPATASLLELGRQGSQNSLIQLLSTIKKRASSYNEQFAGDQQNDAHEFLRTFLCVVHDEMNVGWGKHAAYEEIKDIDNETEPEAYNRWKARIKAVDDSVVYNQFGGMLRSRCLCRKCGHISFTFDPFLDLTISCAGGTSKSVTSALRQEYQSDEEEELRGDRRMLCSKCKAKQPSIRSTCVVTWPRNLVLHLNRFRGDGSKDSSMISYPVFFTVEKLKYRLYAVCCHNGSAKGGHYTSYVSVDIAPSSSWKGSPHSPGVQTWFLCNDSTITVETYAESYTDTAAAYILFYSLVHS